jgi:curli production assembly/transport component CsgE
MFGNRRIFQGQISPNRHQIKMLSEAAVDIAYKAVTEGEMQRLLFKDPDIGQDEI